VSGAGSETLRTLTVVGGLWRSTRGGPAAVAAVQQARLADLVEHAERCSPFYRAHYRQVGRPARDVALSELPATSKPQLMDRFDDVVTDPALRRDAVEQFVADPDRVGELLHGRYSVYTTSGTTGRPGVFLHDPGASAVYQALVARLYLSVLSLQLVRRRIAGHRRTAAVFVSGGHFAGAAGIARAQRQYPRLAAGSRLFSALDPLPTLVRELNEFRPAMLAGYPSALDLLAAEQREGRLHLTPALLLAGGEHLSAAARQRMQEAFGAPVRDTYSASEFPGMAYDCGHGWLHLHADWLVLEPVTSDHAPVPPGELSDTVLLTNLANRVQPLIRYDLGDRVLVSPDPCPCGSPLPALRVEGRTNDVLTLTSAGTTVRVLPLALVTVVEDVPGVRRCQLVQSDASTLRVRLDTAPTADADTVWEQVLRRLEEYLTAQGAGAIGVERASEKPVVEERSGKLGQVIVRSGTGPAAFPR
jgi:phenylacetate-coenzyme A ligase PaaK-like adenylate-forming protein